MSRAEKGVVYLNQHNRRSLMKLNEVKKFCNGTMAKIQENLIDMVNKNELGRGNKRLKRRDYNDKDIKRSTEMLDKIDQDRRMQEGLKALKISVKYSNGLQKKNLEEELKDRELNARAKYGALLRKRDALAVAVSELYFVKFIINPEEDDVEPRVVFGRSFLRPTKGIVDFRNRIITIYPDLITFNDDSDDELDVILASIDVTDLPPLDITDIPPFMCSMGKTDTGSNINVIPYRIYEKLGREKVKPVSHKITMLDHSKAEPMEILKDVPCQVGVTTILAKFFILDIPVDRDVPIVIGRSFLYTCGGILNTIKGTTSTFDGVCHQKFYVAEVRNNHGESDSDNKEEYCLKRDEMGKPFYGPNRVNYLSYDDPMDQALAIQESLNPFKKICVWKKTIVFLDYCSEDQYAISIKEDTAYPCLHSPKTTKGMKINTPYPEDQYAVFKIWNQYNILEDIKRGPYSK
ncbi:DNA-directed DNA polymerase [Tanacetum coccineum]|uniref:DNA-directed DNA polymerase n=1 Tax=Tanacetum coccineum TaxID=301880 RepID=A0ABQ5G290_9ASTR